MKRDFEALRFILDKIKIKEPACVLTVSGNGKDIIYETLIKRLEKLKKDTPLLNISATTEEELNKFIGKIKSQTLPLISIINLSIGKDVSWFFDDLEALRRKNGTAFNYIVITYFKDVANAYGQKHKALMRSIKILDNVTFNDAEKFIKDLSRRFSYKLTADEIRKIYGLSDGHVGLIKSLYMCVRKGEPLDKKIWVEPSIESRLQAIREDKKTYSSKEKKDYVFSSKERVVFNVLELGVGKVIERSEIAERVWGNSWEENYSDWAIDQIIHRLRGKIRKNKLAYKILTNKGLGFTLLKK
ncbi:MAG: hypothetical protein ACD_52C00024G0008 [uncultured bacterium]|nr:MAG: hypothetical protein ACD_52C00024G0008 [uncultured bacterium]